MLATAGCAAALAFASPASAQKFDQSVAADCPAPISQQCAPMRGMTVSTTGPLYFTFKGAPGACASAIAHWFIASCGWPPRRCWMHSAMRA